MRVSAARSTGLINHAKPDLLKNASASAPVSPVMMTTGGGGASPARLRMAMSTPRSSPSIRRSNTSRSERTPSEEAGGDDWKGPAQGEADYCSREGAGPLKAKIEALARA